MDCAAWFSNVNNTADPRFVPDWLVAGEGECANCRLLEGSIRRAGGRLTEGAARSAGEAWPWAIDRGNSTDAGGGFLGIFDSPAAEIGLLAGVALVAVGAVAGLVVKGVAGRGGGARRGGRKEMFTGAGLGGGRIELGKRGGRGSKGGKGGKGGKARGGKSVFRGDLDSQMV
jgi:hypothetical protein